MPALTFPPSTQPMGASSAAPVRPGAGDAFNLPSLQNGQRVPRTVPKAQCVGQLKDKADNGRG